MSSDEEDRHIASRPAAKRQRPGFACDMCRKRKLKCNGKQAGSTKCTNCIDHNWDCTFLNAPGKKVVPGYIEALELKVKKLQSLIHRMLPGQDFTREVGFELTRDNCMLPGVCGTIELEEPSAFVAGSATIVDHAPETAGSSTFSVIAPSRTTLKAPITDDEHSSDEDRRDPPIKLQNLRGASQWVSWSHHINIYFGNSLGTGLIKTAFEMCKEVVSDDALKDILRLRSKVYDRPAWLDGFGNVAVHRPFHFPEDDLLNELVELYFSHMNILSPVLHRPTFEQDLWSNLHLRDRTFATVVLLVCAIGSRFSQDPRVLATGDNTRLSSGWKWFTQTRVLDDAALVYPSSHLHVLQAICLGTTYVTHISLTHAWMYIGIGIRLAVDIGAHKRRAYGSSPTLEDEMFKRVFWILVYMDRTMSTVMGRPNCIQEEDFDLEPIHCCDDEYLVTNDPERIGNQPSDKPSLLTYFVWSLKLAQIQGLAQRTLYASTKAKAHFNFQGEEWLARTVAHFDSLLNQWHDSVPNHLRWDPAQTNQAFLIQSAQLYARYYTTQFIVHRVLISAPRETPVSFPSLAICTNAARSLMRLGSVMHRRQRDHIGTLTWMIQNAALVTLIALGHARLGNINLDRKQALADVDMVMDILREGEARWRWSGRQADVVESLRILGAASVDESTPGEQRKRLRGAEGPTIAAVPGIQLAAPSAQLFQAPTLDHVDYSTAGNQWGITDVFDNTLNDEYATYAMPNQPHEALQQSNGTVLGNVDFDALFGFGSVPAAEGLRPWSPTPFDRVPEVPSAGAPAGSGEGMAFGAEGWSGMTYDYLAEDLQWMTAQQGMPSQGYPTGYGQPQY